MIAPDAQGAVGHSERSGDLRVWQPIFVAEKQKQLIVRTQAVKVLLEALEADRDLLRRIESELLFRRDPSAESRAQLVQLPAGHAQHPGPLQRDVRVIRGLRPDRLQNRAKYR